MNNTGPATIPVSVVMTTFNGERFLEQQLQSLFAQTYPAVEIIACDDHSTDHTPQILKQFADKGLLKFYRNETRLGVLENFKKAVSLASPGNYIALCDQDDIWLPEKLEYSAALLTQTQKKNLPGMIYSDLVIVDDHNHIISPSLHAELGADKYRHCFETLLFGNFVTGCTVMMNVQMRELFAAIPDDPSFIYDTWIALTAFGFGTVAELPQSYIRYRKHTTNVTFSHHRRNNRIKRLKDHAVSLLGKNDFLKDRIRAAKLFYGMYGSRLSPAHQEMIMRFIQLDKASYIRKKIIFESVFAGKWIKRF